MFGTRTVTKKPWSSMRLDQSTPRLDDHKSKTQFFSNATVSMHYGDQPINFVVYQDQYVGIKGIDGAQLPLISMDVDEDLQTTDSVLRFGIDICVKDLKQSLLIPREQTQTNLSETSYEDC